MKTNHRKITRELCERNILFFFPSSTKESEQIQQNLFNLGFIWALASTRNFSYTKACVQKGILLLGMGDSRNKPGLYTAGDCDSYKEKGLLCTLSQFKTGDGPEGELEDQASLRDEFNDLAGAVKKMAAQIEEMHEEVMPQKIDKSSGPKL